VKIVVVVVAAVAAAVVVAAVVAAAVVAMAVAAAVAAAVATSRQPQPDDSPTTRHNSSAHGVCNQSARLTATCSCPTGFISDKKAAL
jgi:Spy/CpxP family protein refolding chaperone